MERSRGWTGVALGVAVAALALRLYDLDLRSISHPEVYVPGIPLPPVHSVPPPRLTWSDTLWMHFHDEPHPMGWYLAMFLWTGLAGVSEWALRLPSAVLGAASVWLAFALGRRSYSAPAGALAASLLALHGFHLFLSQTARMYAAGTFFGLLATALLIAFVYGSGRRRLSGAGYVLSVLATAGSVEFVWPLLGIHILWATLVLPMRPFRWSDLLRVRFSGAHPAIQLQALAVMVSAPELLHSVYRARHGAVEQRALEFLREYLSFGFLFATDRSEMPVLSVPMAAAVALLVVGLGLIAWGGVTRARKPQPSDGAGDLPRWLPPLVALIASGFMIWLASIALYRNEALMVVSTGPVLALWLPALARAVAHVLTRSRAFVRWRARSAGPRLLVVLLGLAAPLALFVLSAKVAILANRAFLIFLPYLVILVAGALAGIGPRLPRLGATVAMIGVFAASVPYSFTKPGSPNDYKSLVMAMMPHYRPDDLILVLDKAWVEAPFFYYLPDAHYAFTDYDAVLRDNPGARIWLVTWPYEDMPVVSDARREALAAYRREQHVTARRASAELFLPPGG